MPLKQEELDAKKKIIDRLSSLLDDTDNLNSMSDEFRDRIFDKLIGDFIKEVLESNDLDFIAA